MLREIRGVRQDNPGLTRRWYQDEFFDLYTWHTAAGKLAGFQLCYDLPRKERALTWHQKHGFSHSKVDAGDNGRVGGSPLLEGTAPFPHRLVRSRFIKHAATIDAPTREAIIDKMREYGRAMARGGVTVPRRQRPSQDKVNPT